MRQLTMISHFNGIGLFPLAAAQAGILTIATTEIDPFCNAVSAQHFPLATQYTDIRTATGLPYADIICGGDPCQPHSSFGLGKGTADIRFLWPEMRRSIDEGRPTWVVNENVIGSVSNGVLDGKASDLEALGYACQTFDIPAGATGAAHYRGRIVLVAHNPGGRRQQLAHLPLPNASHALSQHPRLVGPARAAHWNPSIGDVLRMADGSAEGLDATERSRRIKALGNGIDPHVFAPIFQAIQSIEGAA
jgi:DNA (cytosine-5)-methyltransferase 1